MKTHLLLTVAFALGSFACSSNDDAGTDGATGGTSAGVGGTASASGGSNSGSGGSNNSGSGGSNDSGSGGSTGACTPDYGCQPPVLPSTGDPAADCVARVNQYRACVCVPPLERWTEAEDCADQQAEHDVDNGPHAGFSGGICSPSGSAQNECPGWGSVEQIVDGCLQMMFDEGPTDESCPTWCVEKGHHINMTDPTATHVACGFHTTGDGEVWSVQNFK